ncbi:hypothetical protein CAL26_09190 [Bordetella genomosp. 9]|uniref:Uncharacterized protein n=2 Tax=Bordetella genomosp. 9 TaxID=1416803 RepID=A0A261RF59_9BORD|nr:hypothetical protein CAL26_09190 [Bordetella genomosp. 9]
MNQWCIRDTGYLMNVLKLFSDEKSARAKQSDPAPAHSFEQFWAAWPRRTAKRAAQKAWARMTPDEQAQAMEALPQHVRYWRVTGTESQYIPHPATWLNGARWEDEIELPQKAAPAQRESGPGWWTSHSLMERKGRDVGVGPARAGETTDQYRARIQQAIEEQVRFGKVA